MRWRTYLKSLPYNGGGEMGVVALQSEGERAKLHILGPSSILKDVRS